ncbi:BolA/IbaG family iron-sulfur metabolism protein [Haliea sp. E1-2-M8]|uniref:BolA family protein n=1 Tax=Haliea sp. E1-2-M8 TaxID=3064706 RepID=UPI0027207D91|nr:BolA/IbaG family iron-sulfur metabolism protein [Haliea sp. E1-2-M8]MDO8860714.1 BolA/IbaG family iron-sulfur metabolism protein [Haliea sp. E1-2-M8]
MSAQQQITEQLAVALAPIHLEVANESHMHSVPPNSETHFRVVVVSEAFSGLRQVARHQKIYSLLAAQLEGPVHALALHTYAPGEWEARASVAPVSPDCLGGGKADAGGGS